MFSRVSLVFMIIVVYGISSLNTWCAVFVDQDNTNKTRPANVGMH